MKATKVPFNIIDVHTYSGGLDPDAALESPTLPGVARVRAAALGSITSQGLPVLITETGYTTDGTITNNQQAEYLVRSFVDYQAEGVQKNFWFKFHEDGSGTENEYGITSLAGAPKPAYVAYATMARHLQDATFATPYRWAPRCVAICSSAPTVRWRPFCGVRPSRAPWRSPRLPAPCSRPTT